MKNTVFAAALASMLMFPTAPAFAAGNAMDPLETITTAMNSIPDVIFFKDMDGIYRGGNSAWGAVVGKNVADLVGKSDFDLFPAEMAKGFAANDKAMLASGKARRNNEWLVYPDGRKVYVETLKTPWLDRAGKVVGLLGVCHEIAPPDASKPGAGK